MLGCGCGVVDILGCLCVSLGAGVVGCGVVWLFCGVEVLVLVLGKV